MFWICDPFGLGTFMRCKTSPQKGSENRFCEWVSKQNCQTPCGFFFFNPSFVLGPTKCGTSSITVSGDNTTVGPGGRWRQAPSSLDCIFSLYFGFASLLLCVSELSGCWWGLGWAFTCGFLAVRRERICWASLLLQGSLLCCGVSPELTEKSYWGVSWTPVPSKMRLVPHFLLFLLSASSHTQFSHFRHHHSVVCCICCKSNAVAPPFQFSPPQKIILLAFIFCRGPNNQLFPRQDGVARGRTTTKQNP